MTKHTFTNVENRARLHPLEWDQETQKWSWPPTADYRLFTATVENWEGILRVLAEGPILRGNSRSAATLLAEKVAERGGWEIRQPMMSKLLLELETLGLIEKEKPSKQARIVDRIALAVPVEQLPDKLLPKPALPKHVVAAEVARELTYPKGDIESPDPETLTFGEDASADDIAASLVAMLTGPVDAEAVADAERERQRGNKLAAELRQFREDNAKLLANQKDLRMKLDESEHKRRQLERNLQAALQAARDLADRAGVTARQAAFRDTERTMQNRDRP